MADSYLYTGIATLGYPNYLDTATRRTLIASPGGIYGIQAATQGLPVPPADGRWDILVPVATPAPRTTAPKPEPVPSAVKDGEAA